MFVYNCGKIAVKVVNGLNSVYNATLAAQSTPAFVCVSFHL